MLRPSGKPPRNLNVSFNPREFNTEDESEVTQNGEDCNQAEIELSVETVRDETWRDVYTVIGNHTWRLHLYKEPVVMSDESTRDVFTLEVHCNEETLSDLWSCTAVMKLEVTVGERRPSTSSRTRDFNRQQKLYAISGIEEEDNHKIQSMKLTIKVIHSNGRKEWVWSTFDAPKENLTDVILVVEGKECHVSKQVLSLHSKKFYDMFWVQRETKTAKKIRLRDVTYWEFIELLNMIYPSDVQIDCDLYERILKTAIRFEVPSVVERMEKFLIDTYELVPLEKLVKAEQYNLSNLQHNVINSFKSTHELADLPRRRFFSQLSPRTITLLFLRMENVAKSCPTCHDTPSA